MDLTIQELESKLESATDEHQQLHVLHELSYALILSDPDRGKQYARKQLQIAKKLSDKSWIVKSYVRLSDAATMRARFPLALQHLKRALALLPEFSSGMPEQALVYSRLGRTYLQLGQTTLAVPMLEAALEATQESTDHFENAKIFSSVGGLYYQLNFNTKALALLTEALRVFREHSFNRGIASALYNIGKIYTAFGEPEKALHNYEQSIDIARQIGDKHNEALTHKSVGDAYTVQNKFGDALQPYRNAKALFDALGDIYQSGQSTYRIGHIYALQGEYVKAMECCKEALELFESINSDIGRAEALTGIAEVLLYDRKQEEAVVIFEQALEIYHEKQLPTQIAFLHNALALTYEEMGEMQNSLLHYKEHMRIQEVMHGYRVRNELLSIELREQVRDVEAKKESHRERTERRKQEAEARANELATMSLRIEHDNKILEQLRERLLKLDGVEGKNKKLIDEVIGEIDTSIYGAEARYTFQNQLQELKVGFVQALKRSFPLLTPAEVRVCILLTLNLSNKEISTLLNVSTRTLDAQRSSIRKKLGLQRKDSLVVFLSGL